MHVADGHGHGLGTAVSGKHRLETEASLQGLGCAGRQRHRRPDAGGVVEVVRTLRLVKEPDVHSAEREYLGGAVAANARPEVTDGEAGFEPDGQAVDQGGEDIEQPGTRVEHRRAEMEDVAWADVPADGHRIGGVDPVGIGLDHALGPTGRPRGE